MTNFVGCVISAILLHLCCKVHSKSYSLALLGLASRYDGTQNSRYDLLLINQNTVDIVITVRNVNGPIKKLVLSAYGETIHTLHPEYSLNGSELANKTIMISSAHDFTLQVFSQSEHHTEGFIAIPLDDLRGPHTTPILYEYSVTTYCADSGICQMGVSALNGATVKFTFPNHLNDIVFCIGKSFFRSSRDSVLKLSRYDAVQIETTQDLTGTRISSNSPIGVYVGSRNLSNDGIASHTLEQLPTISQWGTEYGVANKAQFELWDIVIVTARVAQRTTVEMSGFGTFIVDGQEKLTRRLVRDEYTMIKADKPIQVVQVTGFVYNSSDTASVVSMAVVPAIEHGNDFTRVTCGSENVQSEFVVINGNRSLVPQANGIDMLLDVDLVYSDFQIYTHSAIGLIMHTVTGDKVSGVVHCGTGPLFSIGLTHADAEQEKGDTKLDEITGTCIEGEMVEYKCDLKGRAVQTIEERNFAEFDLLKLRVKICGNAVVQFTLENGFAVVILLFTNTISINICDRDGGCNRAAWIKDRFNNRRFCHRDIAWYWFRETTIDDKVIFGVGTGPVAPPTEQAMLNFTDLVELPSSVHGFTLAGLFANVSFNYDLEPASGCARRVSDWRCENVFQNCSLYDKTTCKDAKYQYFSKRICPRYCGKCKLDGYGRKFVGVIPKVKLHGQDDGTRVDHRPRIYIKPSKPSGFIAAATEEIIPGMESGIEDMYFIFLDILMQDTIFWIVSDVDLLVVVFIPVPYLNASVTYNLFPVDTFAREFQSIENYDTSVGPCQIVTDGTPTEVKIFFRGDLVLDIMGILQKRNVFSIDPYEVKSITGLKSQDASEGFLIKSDKPIGVFCRGDLVVPCYNQLLPLNILGTRYRIPKLDMAFRASPSILQLFVQGSHSFTMIKLIGDTVQTHILSSTGERANFRMNPHFQYEVLSSHVISVGLQITVEGFSTFLLIPPVKCFSNDVDTAIPVDSTRIISTVTSSGSNLGTYPFGILQNGVTTTWSNDSAFGIVVTHQYDLWSIATSSFVFEEHDESNEICDITKAAEEDGIDNDCDGAIDEEICCGQDNDLDGTIGEDHWIVTEQPQIDVGEPECIPIDKPDDQCWMLCRCPCAWVENLLTSNKLSPDEFLRLQQIKALVIQKNLKVNKKDLVKVTAQKMSAEDPRQSAANVGYVGVGMFMLAVAFIVFLDITAITRDLKVLLGNLGDSLFRFIRWITCGMFKSEINQA